MNEDIPRITLPGETREVDIMMDDFIIQVKSKRGNNLVKQLKSTQADTAEMVIGYAPDRFSQHAWQDAAEVGLPIARSYEELVQIIQEYSRR